MKQNKGFSTIELLVTLVIISILAALALPRMFGGNTLATTVRCKEAAVVLNAAESAYYAYRTKTRPMLTITSIVGVEEQAITVVTSVDEYTTDKITRLNMLRIDGYIETEVNPDDVTLDSTTVPPIWRAR